MTGHRATPKGTLVRAEGPEGSPIPGQIVIVTNASGLDAMCEGRSGELLGYTLTHSYAVIAWEGRELLVHPESLIVKP